MKIYQIRRFASLPGTDQVIFFRSYFLLWSIVVGMWLVPFFVLQKVLNGISCFLCFNKPVNITPKRIVDMVIIASRYIPKTTCLSRALATQALLACYGYSSVLHIGVIQDDDSQFEAHAWVEVDNRVIIGGSEDKTYTRLASFKKGVK